MISLGPFNSTFLRSCYLLQLLLCLLVLLLLLLLLRMISVVMMLMMFFAVLVSFRFLRKAPGSNGIHLQLLPEQSHG